MVSEREVTDATSEVLHSGFGRRHSVRSQSEVVLVVDADEKAEWAIKEKLRGAFPTCDAVLL